MDLVFAGVLTEGTKLAEELAYLIGFEMDALDLMVEAAALDSGPLNDGGSGSGERVAHVLASLHSNCSDPM